MRDLGDNANIALSRGLSLQGGIFGLALAILSGLSIRIGPIEAGFTLVPLIAVFIWPRGASNMLSSYFIFTIGFFVDVLSAGPPGLWAFIYLAFYGLFRPDQRYGTPSLAALWPQFLLWLLSAFIAAVFIGQLFIEGRTSVGALVMQVVAAAFLFPVVYFVRQGLRHLVSDPSDPGYTR